MLFAILADVLGSDPRLGAVTATLNKQLDQIDAIANEIEREVDTDTLIPLDMVQLGLVINSEETVDEQKLHPVRVVAVYSGGPASSAGIRPGDRILSIGQRKLEHETTVVVYDLLTHAPNPIHLTIRHGNQAPVEVVADARQLDCVGRGARSIDKAAIRKRLAGIRAVSAGSRKMIVRYSEDPVVLGNVGKLNMGLIRSVVALGADLLGEIHECIAVACRAEFVAPGIE